MNVPFADTLALKPFANGKDHLLGPAQKDLVHRGQVYQSRTELGAFSSVDPALVDRDIHLLPAKDMMQRQAVHITVLKRLQLLAENDRGPVPVTVHQRKMAFRFDGQRRFYQGNDRCDPAARGKSEIILS